MRGIEGGVVSSGDGTRFPASFMLRNGLRVTIRPIRLDDEDRMLALFYRFSPRTVYLRFHHMIKEMSREDVRRFCTVDYSNSYALVATVDSDSEEKIIAVGRYARLSNTNVAEVAFVVEDPYQGQGLGTHLLYQLALIAREHGITVFEAEVLAENEDMLRVLKDSGYHMVQEFESGVCRAVLDIAPATAEDVSPWRGKKWPPRPSGSDPAMRR
ncbi:MAG: GNAT family N-acetyltransferase [Dehalococcoidia bacterium]|nr:GNAT family N-acetyltransferase [Dehalococcoidia bacterium]